MGICCSNSCTKKSFVKKVKEKNWELSPEHKEKLRQCNDEDVHDFSLDGIDVWAKVVDIYDGDTFRLAFFMPHGEIVKFKMRGEGYNCPELYPPKNHSHREEEMNQAFCARNKLLELVCDSKIDLHTRYSRKDIRLILSKNNKLVWAKLGSFEKYGRLLVTMYTEGNKEKSINQILVEEKYAVEYHGEKRNKNELTLESPRSPKESS